MRSTESLAAFLNPTSVAVVGASRDPSKVGGSVLANLRAGGFPGRVIPVNSRGESVQGLAAVPSILDVDEPIDLAVIAVPAPSVLNVLKECVTKGVKGAVVITAGFRESGAEGREREQELRAWIHEQPLRLLGPNCLGWIRPSRRLNLTFAPGMPVVGSLGFFSHSGALCAAILDWSKDHGVGFSLFASLGNQADLNETDLIELLAEDPETRVILGYVEGVADGRAFFEALRRAAAKKPCVLMKAGRSLEGARAISSHTGALAGSDQAFEAAVRQAGAVRAGSVEELFDLARALATQPLPTNRKLVVVTNGGGLGILATDSARECGLDVSPLDETLQARLGRVLSRQASLRNPVDLIGDATSAHYHATLAALEGGNCSTMVLLTPQAATDSVGVARAILGVTRGWETPVLAVFAGGPRVRPGIQVLEEGGVPCYPFPERAARALAGMVTLAEQREQRPAEVRFPVQRDRAVSLLARHETAGLRRIGFLEGAPLLDAYGMRTIRGSLARTPEEALEVATALGFPVALKIVSPEIPHKSEVGGVRLDLTSADEASAAMAVMLARVRAERPDARIDGVLVQQMAPAGGKEMLLGMVRDPQFGPLVVIGFGGIYVELLKDTVTRLAPLLPSEALAMIEELRMAPALKGARGEPPVDLSALVETICRFAQLVWDFPQIEELEVNPLLVSPAGTIAVDIRGVLARREERGGPREIGTIEARTIE
jgi:acetyltransferase